MARKLWQAPPNWPDPPAGWVPPPGWQPDPSWPSPPAGWVWWRPARRTVGERVLRTLGIGVPLAVVAGFAALFFQQARMDAAGCGSIDPTDPGGYSVVTLLNDTSQPVVLADCRNDYCATGRLPITLAPGKRYIDDAACAASGRDMTSWRVTTAHGATLGYIAVDTPRKHDGVVFRISNLSADPSTPTPAG